MCDGSPLHRPVSTGRQTEVRLEPFTVYRVFMRPTWDPASERLQLAYQIADRHSLIRHGRVVYSAGRLQRNAPDQALPEVGDELSSLVGIRDHHFDWTVVHRLELKPEDWSSGAHGLEMADRWDGEMTEGPWVGRVVGYEQTVIRAEVFVWDEEEADPERSHGVPPAGWRSSDSHTTRLKIVRNGRWGSTFAIPYGDPLEPEPGKVELSIETGDIPDDTPVTLIVARIGEFVREGTDRVYAISGMNDERQPEMASLRIRGNRIVNGNGNNPVVRFCEYDEHWKYPGNNFYAAWVRIGSRAPFVPATERNYLSRERNALHFRFTVLIYACPTNSDSNRVRRMNDLRNFISQDTKYFRPYHVSHTPGSTATLRRYIRHRYIVLFLGHGWADCWNPSHPIDPGRDRPNDMPHSGFPPDRNVCPDQLIAGQEHTLIEARAHYESFHVGLGCGHGDAVRHLLLSIPLMFGSAVRGAPGTSGFLMVGRKGEQIDRLEDAFTLAPSELPRFYFHLGGCRTFLTDRLARGINMCGTKHVTGWTYTVDGWANTWLIDTLMRQWLYPPDVEEGDYDEWDEARFLRLLNQFGSESSLQEFEPRYLNDAGRRAFVPESELVAEAVN